MVIRSGSEFITYGIVRRGNFYVALRDEFTVIVCAENVRYDSGKKLLPVKIVHFGRPHVDYTGFALFCGIAVRIFCILAEHVFFVECANGRKIIFGCNEHTEIRTFISLAFAYVRL